MIYIQPLLKQKTAVVARRANLGYIPDRRLPARSHRLLPPLPGLRTPTSGYWSLVLGHHRSAMVVWSLLSIFHPLPCFSPWEAPWKSTNSFRAHNLRQKEGRNIPPQKSKKGSTSLSAT